jgi:hypothetical protein
MEILLQFGSEFVQFASIMNFAGPLLFGKFADEPLGLFPFGKGIWACSMTINIVLDGAAYKDFDSFDFECPVWQRWRGWCLQGKGGIMPLEDDPSVVGAQVVNLETLTPASLIRKLA